MPMNHTQYRCVNEIPRDNNGNEIGASAFQAGMVAEYERMKTAGPIIFDAVVAAVTAIKVAVSIATQDPFGLASAGYGVIASVPKYFEISQKFEKGEKWLKDRKNRELTYEDIEHYRRVIAALEETLRLQDVLDAAIEELGGIAQV